MTPMIDSQTSGVATQRINAMNIKHATIAMTNAINMCCHESIRSSTII